MVVLFHSKGATAEGHAGMLAGLEPCRLIVPEGVLSTSGGGRLWWEKGVIAAMEQPEAAAVQWRVAAARIIVFLRALVQCRPTVGSPIVTGSSMGAEMAYLMATLYPREVYGAVAVNGYLIPPLWSPDMAPTLSLHGTSDRTVPYDWDAEYVAAMAERGAPIRMESFDAGHAITTAMSRAWSAAVDRLIQGVASGADASLVL
jgi:predicted esterase